MSTERKLVGAEETLSTERRDGSSIDCVNRRKQRGRRVVVHRRKGVGWEQKRLCPQKEEGMGPEKTLST